MSKDSNLIGNSLTEVMIPEVTCIGHTSNPLGVLFSVWHGSRHHIGINPVDIEKLYRSKIYNQNDIDLYTYLKESYPTLVKGHTMFDQVRSIIESVVKLALKVNVQNTEFISYEFQVDKASVAWREQLVRKRQLHVWTQTSRVADMTSFDTTIMPTIEMFGGSTALNKYKEAVQYIRDIYKSLINLGIPSEDIRLQPQSYIHRVYFGCNLRQLLDLIKDRTSWIAQATLWMPIVTEIVNVLKITLGDWIKDYLKAPAVVKNGKIVEYDLISDDKARYEGKDPLPVSPIYLAMINKPNNYKDINFYNYMKSMYIDIWPDDVLKAIDWNKEEPYTPGIYDVGYEGTYWNGDDCK